MKEKRMMSRLKVLLIESPCLALDDDSLEPPMGILMIASVLKKRGILVQVLDLSGHTLNESYQILEGIEETPTVVGFSTLSASYSFTMKLAIKIRQLFPKAKTIAGGPHASALPEEVAKSFDYVLVGEAEITLLELLEKLEKNISSLSILIGKPIQNLDDLPYPDYSLVSLHNYTRKVEGKQSLSIFSSRGCLYDCAFCNSRVFPRKKKNFRFRSAEHVAKEIHYLHKSYGITNYRFQDDLFTFNRERIEAIAKLSPDIRYRCFARADALSMEMCHTLISTGCYHVAVGIESGSKKILSAMCKNTTPEIMRQGLINAHAVGLHTRIYLIVGFPGETDETISETISFLDTMPFDEFLVYPAIPYPGTPLHQQPEKFGIVWKDPDYSKYIQVGKKRCAGYVLKTQDFGPENVKIWRDTLIDRLNSKGAKWYGETQELLEEGMTQECPINALRK
jgi:anaerobic magnesium-protoporphyrin IX monomethyl ester cyclase